MNQRLEDHARELEPGPPDPADLCPVCGKLDCECPPEPCPECGIRDGHKIFCKTGNERAKRYQDGLES